MLHAVVILLIIACAAVLMNEGVFSAAVIFFCTILGGLIAFNYYEPVAGLLARNLSFLVGYEDIIAILGIFALAVTGLRLVTEQIAPTMVELPDIVHRGGGLIIGAATGWVLSGILICAFQTLPWHQNFWGYDYKSEKGNGWNSDRYWLAYVHRATGSIFESAPPERFDPGASFTIRYHDFRRRNDQGQVAATGSAATMSPGQEGAGRTGRRRGSRGGGLRRRR
jgi:hypothetical protein